MNNRYHIWANNPDWTDDPKTNGAGFIGYADTIDGVINAVSLRLKNKEEKAKPYYAVVTMGDMYSEYDPDDIVVEYIGNFTNADAKKLMHEWEKEYEEELSNGCWISTVMDESPEACVLLEEINVWDGVNKGWFRFDDDMPTERQRQQLEGSVDRWDGCEACPIMDFHDDKKVTALREAEYKKNYEEEKSTEDYYHGEE